MDADVYGPTVPILLGLEDAELKQVQVRQPNGDEVTKIVPASRHGVSCVSMGFLVRPARPWCGAARC